MKRVSRLLFCLTILVMTVYTVQAQNAAKNWVFGYGARIDFNSTPPTVLTAPPIVIDYGSASISDSSGNLLFYTDGEFVWNKNNTRMPNGFGLLGNEAPTHPALIVPCNCGKYFIFTTGSHHSSYNNGFRYSIVDMSLDGGNGDVTAEKNVQLQNRTAEKIAGVSDGNGGFWVVTHNMGDNQFFSYHIPAGSNCMLVGPTPTPVVSSFAGEPFVGGFYAYGPGQMKISPNGKRLAVAGFNDPGPSFLELFGFDTTTGKVTQLAGPVWNNNDFYGVEFSPDSKSLYATTHSITVSRLYRYDISANTLPAPSLINDYGAGAYLTASIQLGPDGNLYIARFDQTYLSVLPNPNAPGPWTDQRLNLAPPARSSFGTPTMIAGDFSCGQQGCCDQVKLTPFWMPDLSLSWKAFEVFNVKYPASNICSINIDIRSATNQPPPNPWNGGGLKVNGTALPVPDWWRSPYTRIPNGDVAKMIAAQPNFSAAAVNFNLGLDYSGAYTGKVKLIFRHCDGTTCEYLSDNWTPEPPTQLAMRSSERYLGDLRSEFLPLALAFSDGVNIKRKAAWIAVEPLDADTEVFSVDGDRVEIENSAARQPQVVIASARKQERSALYELAKPIDLERFTGGEIKLVLKRSAGNSIKPRLRFLFFDENANLIGYTTSEGGKFGYMTNESSK